MFVWKVFCLSEMLSVCEHYTPCALEMNNNGGFKDTLKAFNNLKNKQQNCNVF